MMQQNYKKKSGINFLKKVILFSVVFLFTFFTKTEASIIDVLKEKIGQRTEQIKTIEKEIVNYKENLNKVGQEKQTLQTDIQSLNVAKRKIDGEINITEKNIQTTNKTITELEKEIEDKETSIVKSKLAIRDTLKNLQYLENTSVVENFLSGKTLVETSEYTAETSNFQDSVNTHAQELVALKDSLDQKKGVFIAKKTDLSKFKTELSGKKTAVVQTEAEKAKILAQAKSKEAEYQKMLAEKLKQKEIFEREIFQFESELKLAVDPSKLPGAKAGVIFWPLDNIYITQYFGSTVAAQRLYTSGSHNGVDLRATDGTKVKASLSGSVWAVGNTDIKKGCYSYGKWVLIKHANGLSTLYGHLSAITAVPGTNVTTGDTIGYSGRTGYVTGPHLHLSVLATEGTRVMAIPPERSKNCSGITIPIADPKAYLDPMLYLPGL
jgi:murein DD-endopeptidase MepM/ murein hydrolase activator NlpD